MASPLFCHGFLDDFGFEALFGVHFFKPSVLFLKFAQTGHQRGVHAAELRTPFVERGRTDAVLAAQLWRGGPASACLRMAMILLSEKSDVFTQNFLDPVRRKFYF